MKTQELRAKSAEELKGMVVSLKQETFNLRFQKAMGTLENANRFNEIRKTIARAKTLINEKAAAPAAPAKKGKKG